MKYSVIIPVFNEEEVLAESYKRLKEVMDSTGETYELLFVDDGSRDQSKAILTSFAMNDPSVKLLSFSRNFGHQPAITAGIDHAGGEAVVIIDCDLQDPPRVILEMIKKWKEGYQVVYGQRLKRKGETMMKKFTAKTYYRLLKSMTNFDIPVDTGDFRLMDRKVCEAIKSLHEKNRYMRGMVSWVGFKQTAVLYERDERFAGETKYPFKKMIKLAFDGITSFSHKPLKLGIGIGFFMSLLSFLYLLFIIYQKLFTASTITGWPSTVAIILFSQGIVLMILGLMGEYIGRIYDEVKGRPIYIVNTSINFEQDKDKNTSLSK